MASESLMDCNWQPLVWLGVTPRVWRVGRGWRVVGCWLDGWSVVFVHIDILVLCRRAARSRAVLGLSPGGWSVEGRLGQIVREHHKNTTRVSRPDDVPTHTKPNIHPTSTTVNLAPTGTRGSV